MNKTEVRTIPALGLNGRWLIIHDANHLMRCSTVSSLLDLVVSLGRSDGAHLYWMDPAAYELRLVSASSTSEDGRSQRVSMEFSAQAVGWLEGLRQPEMVTEGHTNFGCFPETVVSRPSSLLVLPLCTEEKLTGVMTLSRKDARAYTAGEVESTARLGDAAMAAIREQEYRREVESLHEKLRLARRDNTVLEKRLAERKLVERAKGLLQSQCGWTEEDAYYHIRRTSRQQRTPMGVIAQRIIDVTAAKELDGERLTA